MLGLWRLTRKRSAVRACQLPHVLAVRPSTAVTPDEIVAACRHAGVRLVRFLYCDNGGVVRGKTVPVDRLAQRMHTGVGLTVAMQAMNSLDQLQPVEGMGPVGEVRLVPDPDTFTVLPYAAHQRGNAGRPRSSRPAAV